MEALEAASVPRVMLLKVYSHPLSQDGCIHAFLFPVFVCTAALAILDKLDEIDEKTLGWWLAERQLPNGGLNGRPEKLEDASSSLIVQSSNLLDVHC